MRAKICIWINLLTGIYPMHSSLVCLNYPVHMGAGDSRFQENIVFNLGIDCTDFSCLARGLTLLDLSSVLSKRCKMPSLSAIVVCLPHPLAAAIPNYTSAFNCNDIYIYIYINFYIFYLIFYFLKACGLFHLLLSSFQEEEMLADKNNNNNNAVLRVSPLHLVLHIVS